MGFKVKWTKRALSDLASVWMAAADRSAVTSAQITVDRILAADPKGYGTHLSEGLWRVEVLPILVHFEIDDAAGKVRVTQLDLVLTPP